MSRPLDLIFLWHMHQPDYRDYASGDFLLPWVYLHAIKDYADMAFHLEQHPQVKGTVNFVPVLLDQLEDYEQQFATGQIRDPLLRLLARENLSDLNKAERDLALTSCFRSNHYSMVEPYHAYKRLSDLYKMLEPGGDIELDYLSGQYFSDLLTWYHLAWCGESVRREHDLVIRLMGKNEGFNYADRKLLFDLIGQVIGGIIPRYRKLAESGQIELSTTPHYHPLAPLLLDLNSATESLPEISLPQSKCYPGGKSRVQAHLISAKQSHHARFGSTPNGIWPAEGAVSTALLEVLAEQGYRWTATGEGVLANSLRTAEHKLPERAQYLYRPYHLQGVASGVRCFFRDDHLSDLIGFEYSSWNGKDAALHFVSQLESIAQQAPEGEVPVVSVILDGENAWEYYPYNGYHFFADLYSELQVHSTISTTTYSEYLDRLDAVEANHQLAKERELPHLVAGSWVYGNFSTWIGSPDKNRAWDLLCIAKQSYDLVMASARLNEAECLVAEKQLASCESSDWFWWFGDYNPAHAVESFDRLYRSNLMQLYGYLKLPVPVILNSPISQGGGLPESGGTMRRGS
ncbi:glycoside hydrolase family 57 protein [Candidatus Nitrotoga sp. M5]|uniref:glycoside hydrolase family 57 protein n=1 Tax=Candidatus Nitrotoga sp. M5 TaxID=2890409 RepID=UPI001EF3F324|nr:glycoside hydrolase family 57 protein [Candidatus Nitrotoga sp. M5]CAH1387728.1 Glyco_hydro_57 domain-containing protein [Candidatus Nitrotoga sp. M5]